MIAEYEEITRTDYNKYLAMGKDFSEWYREHYIPAMVSLGCGYYGAVPVEINGKYFVKWERGNSCD